MTVEIKKLAKKDYNWAVFRDGEHVDAIVILLNDSDRKWRLWKDKIIYTPSERCVIDAKLAELNTESK